MYERRRIDTHQRASDSIIRVVFPFLDHNITYVSLSLILGC